MFTRTRHRVREITLPRPRLADNIGLLDSGDPLHAIAGLVWDFNADLITGLSDGATVTSWTDSYGGYTVSNVGGGKDAKYAATGLNGQPAVDLATDGGALMRLDDAGLQAIGGAAHTLFVLLRPSATFTAARVVARFVDASASSHYVRLWAQSTPRWSVETSPTANGGNGNTLGTDPIVLDYRWGGPTETIDLQEDGVETLAAKTVNGAPLNMDRFEMGTANIYIARLLLYAGEVSDTDRAAVQAVLLARGGI